MSWMPDDWKAHKASGWWELHRLEHTTCGWISTNAYDLVCEQSVFGRQQARQVVFQHNCDEEW